MYVFVFLFECNANEYTKDMLLHLIGLHDHSKGGDPGGVRDTFKGRDGGLKGKSYTPVVGLKESRGRTARPVVRNEPVEK